MAPGEAGLGPVTVRNGGGLRCGGVAGGYQAGEKITVKINLTACNAAGEQMDPDTYEKKASVMNTIDNSPEMLLALLRHLVYTVGVPQRDISVGDPTGLFPRFMWNLLHPEFPDVQYFDNLGGAGRVRTEFSAKPFRWSTPAARGKRQDYVPVPFAEAMYFINFAVLKGHSSGITLCAKNLYGALSCVGGLDGPRGVGRQDAVVSGGWALRWVVQGLASGSLEAAAVR